MTDIIFTDQLHLDAELENLAKRYKNAGRLGIQVLNLIGTRAEGLLCRLPKPISQQLNYVTWIALEQALLAATKSRKWLPDQSDWLNTVVGTAMGAVGGVGGLPSALAELPVTTTLMLRIIEGVAVEYGFDPMVKSVRLECLHVFSSAGPFEHDDGSDIAFLSTRLMFTGEVVQTVIARVAPRLSTVMGQKLAAQTVPVLGAVAGAATNFAYSNYYTDMAHVHFGMHRLALKLNIPNIELVEMLRDRVLIR